MVFSYASPSRSRPGDDERLRGDHWRPPPRRRVRGAGPADPRRSPAVPLRRKRSMRRVRMCSQSPARVEAAVPAVGPRVGGPRASLARRFPLHRAQARPRAVHARGGHGGLPSRKRFRRFHEALANGVRDPGITVPEREHGNVRNARRLARARAAPAAARALAALRARAFVSARRVRLAAERDVRISRGRLSSRRLVSAEREALRTNGSLRRRASGGAPAPTSGAAAAAQSRARAAAPGPTPWRICAQIMPPRLRLRHCGRVLGGDARPVRDPGAPVRRHTRRRIRAARFALRIFLRKCQ